MHKPVGIDSPANPRIKRVLRIYQQGPRHESGLMVVEGAREVRCAIQNSHIPAELFITESAAATDAFDDITGVCHEHDVSIATCSPRVFDKLAYRESNADILALFPRITAQLEDLELSPSPLLLLAEKIEKPGNLGAILRTADAAGADAVIICDANVDICNPNVVRASVGTVFSVPVVSTDTGTAVSWLEGHAVSLYAASPDGHRLYTEPDYCGSVAFIVGAEHEGLSEPLAARAETRVRIPMHGQADSLNVAGTAAILLYEALRQRST